MANMGEPLWVRSVETGRDILNYDEYVKEFEVENSGSERPKTFIEASRETEVVFMDLPRLLQSFLDVVSVRHVPMCMNIYIKNASQVMLPKDIFELNLEPHDSFK